MSGKKLYHNPFFDGSHDCKEHTLLYRHAVNHIKAWLFFLKQCKNLLRWSSWPVWSKEAQKSVERIQYCWTTFSSTCGQKNPPEPCNTVIIIWQNVKTNTIGRKSNYLFLLQEVVFLHSSFQLFFLFPSLLFSFILFLFFTGVFCREKHSWVGLLNFLFMCLFLLCITNSVQGRTFCGLFYLFSGWGSDSHVSVTMLCYPTELICCSWEILYNFECVRQQKQ